MEEIQNHYMRIFEQEVGEHAYNLHRQREQLREQQVMIALHQEQLQQQQKRIDELEQMLQKQQHQLHGIIATVLDGN